jgi:hypothetical protein
MRLVRAVLFVALTGSWALADEAKPADPKPELTKKKLPYRVVKTLPETGQVLLYDRNHATHVVAELGQTLDGYTIEDIDEEAVTLVGEGGVQVILTAPPPPPAAKRPVKTAGPPAEAYDAAHDGAAASGPVDPYAEPEAPRAAGDGGVRIASATPNPAAPASATASPNRPPAAPIVDSGAPELSDLDGDPGIAAFAEAVGATPPPGGTSATSRATPGASPAPSRAGATSTPTDAPPAPARAARTPVPTDLAPIGAATYDGGRAKAGRSAAPASTSTDAASALAAAATGSPTEAPRALPGAAAEPSAIIARGELDAALGDFGKLAGSFRAVFTTDGLRFDAVAEGTLLAKAGLRKGDVVTSVDGRPLRSLDDAANLYARASSLRTTTIQVTRAGKPVVLRVAIQ